MGKIQELSKAEALRIRADECCDHGSDQWDNEFVTLRYVERCGADGCGHIRRDELRTIRNPLFVKATHAPKPIGSRLRFLVLERDHFRCSYCGVRAKDGAILEVDHIMPVSKGGQTTMENLRTACKHCNVGKSDRIVAEEE